MNAWAGLKKSCPLIKGELGMSLHAILCDVSRSYLATVAFSCPHLWLAPIFTHPYSRRLLNPRATSMLGSLQTYPKMSTDIIGF